MGSDASEEMAHRFRSAMRRLASTVSVVTTRCGNDDFGMTASTVTSVSVHPPALLVCVNKSAAFHRAITSSDTFCVNILSAGHNEVSAAFSSGRAIKERFRVGNWLLDADIPYLKDAQANIFRGRANLFEHGTHSIIVGEVYQLMLNGAVSPLIYVDGRYAAVEE
jgi:flavin reductase (DIM6/NTAB) family NADH-FMN oxidoreductase RutF